jgi:dethiobiotin synthetase
VNGYFVTGTDTNVGKTHVTCALAERARTKGHTVFAFKPIETGCVLDDDGQLVGSDQELLVAAAGGWQRGVLRGLYRFPLPVAPLVAADEAGQEIDLGLVERTIHGAATRHEATLTLVEGAGGWRVPITSTADMSTLARLLDLPVLVVARGGLGTINHTLLTIEAIERDGRPLAGIVLSLRPNDDPQAARSNQTQIRRRCSGNVTLFGADSSVLDGLLTF